MNYNPGDLKAALHDAFKAKVSGTVCVGARPKSCRGVDDFVVVRVISDIKDRGAVGTALCRVELYAKDVCADEDTVKLKKMLEDSGKALQDLAAHCRKYTFIPDGFSDSKSDGFGYHSLSIDLFTTLIN